jgi:hypothetical protein
LLEHKASVGQHPASAKDEHCSEVPTNEVGLNFIKAISMTRRPIADQGDRYIIELGEARELYRTYETLKRSVLTAERIEYLERRYGTGSVQRIRGYMRKLQTGELE